MSIHPALRVLLRLLVLLPLFGFTYVSDYRSWGQAGAETVTALKIFLETLCLVLLPGANWLSAQVARLLRAVARLPETWFVGGCALLFFILTTSLSQILFEGTPHVADTHAQYVHAKIIAGGHLYLPSHKFRSFFDFQNMVNDGRYYSVYAPGHVFLMALAYYLGGPWLLNPFLGALTVIALYLLALEIAGRAVGYVAIVLMLACPLMVFLSAEYMNNSTCELFLTLFLFAYIRQHRTGDWRYAAMAGLCVGYAFITRPQSTLPFALPVAVHAVAAFVNSPRQRWHNTLLLAASFAFWVDCLLYYNMIMNGNPFIQSRTDPLKFLQPFSSWHEIMSHIAADIARLRRMSGNLHHSLFGWVPSSLLFVLLLFLFKGQRRYCGLLAVCCLSQVFSLIINPFFSVIFESRYLYESSTSLILLTALCLVRLPGLLRSRLKLRFRLPSAQGGIAIMVVFLSVSAFPYLSWRYQLYKNDYLEGNMTFYHKLMQTVQPPALVFFKDYVEFRWLYFTLPPADSNPVIVAQDRGSENQKLIDYYPNRSVYNVEKSVITRIK